MRCRYCLHLLQPSKMDAGAFVSVHGARCSNETGHRVAYPWFEVRPSQWADEADKRDLVIHSSDHYSSVWSLTPADLLALLDAVADGLAKDPEVRASLLNRLRDALTYVVDTTPFPLH